MNILVTTCDKNMHLLRGFAYLFNLYWSPNQEVTVLGYAQPQFELPPNFTYFSLGDQKNYPFEKWSDSIIDFLALHPHWQEFALLLEDYYLVRPVDVEAVQLLYRYIEEHRSVIKMDLCADRLGSGSADDFAYLDRLDLIKSNPDSQYHWSWWPGIWNREPLLRVMQRGESCHDEELYGSSRLGSLRNDIMVLGTRQYPLRNITVYKYDSPGELRLSGLRETDVSTLRGLGFI